MIYHKFANPGVGIAGNILSKKRITNSESPRHEDRGFRTGVKNYLFRSD